MILVVYHHLMIYTLSGYQSELNQLFVSFRMPMFFFISGFVAYSEKHIWNKGHFVKSMRKKIEGQLFPSIVVLF